MSHFWKLFKFCLTIHLCFQRFVHRHAITCNYYGVFMLMHLLNHVQRIIINNYKKLQVENPHQTLIVGLVGDYCDGKKFQDHSLYRTNPSALQLIIYYDELELCNPLGSRRKNHKIGELLAIPQLLILTMIRK